MTTDASTPNWPASGLDRKGYLVCYHRALARMAATLNSGSAVRACPAALLRQDDVHLADKFAPTGPYADLTRLHEIAGDSREDLEEKAEDHFYGRFRFSRAPVKKSHLRGVKITHEATDTFIDWSLLRLYRPVATDDVLCVAECGDEAEFARVCATNYLLKNFWHNFVHEKMQHINHENYGLFRGQARFDSDFEADNVANLLLLRSYGETPLCEGRPSARAAERSNTIFERNRCNLVFAERARHRIDDRARTPLDRAWEEYEWRERRALANELSQQLIFNGCAAATLSIVFSGDLVSLAEGRYRKPLVAIIINGVYLAVPHAPYLPDDAFLAEREGRLISKSREAAIRSRRRARRQEIVSSVVGQYRSLLQSSAPHRHAAVAGLKLVWQRAGIL